MRPCLQCIKKGKPEDCLEGMSPEQAELFMQRYCAREALAAQTAASASTCKRDTLQRDYLRRIAWLWLTSHNSHVFIWRLVMASYCEASLRQHTYAALILRGINAWRDFTCHAIPPLDTSPATFVLCLG